ncbi:MAG TPA: hypothetical protein VGF04_00605 [Solirubrobacterales bacterium]|jgi:hypothetical protein
MLAYVFWHRPHAAVARDDYEEAQRGFHGSLPIESACFRVDALPFGDRAAGYEDWYLVEDWRSLGELSAAAVGGRPGEKHDRAAALAGAGWGGLYAGVRGEPAIPAGAEWRSKPPGEPAEPFVASLPGGAIWRRQLVLGPAPEFCLSTAPSRGRVPITPS